MTEGSDGDLARLEADILENGPAYSFGQLTRLLHGRLHHPDAAPGQGLRIRPELSLERPRADVAAVHRRADHYEVVTTFLGLYGAASPLPAFYTEELIEAAQEDRTTAQTLLDALHQHLYELVVAGREKYRPLEGTVERGDHRFTDILRSLVGLRDPEVRRALPDPDRMLRYVPLLGARQRSAEGLRTLLRDALGDMPVEVEECVERNVRIPAASRVRIGEQSHRLGMNAVIGVHVRDRSGRFRVRIGPLDAERFDALLNRENHWHWLVAIIQFYLNAPLQCELDLLLEAGAGATTTLGDPAASRLGTTTWLFSGEPDGIRATLHLG